MSIYRALFDSIWTGDNWKNVSLDEFLDCPYNLANNRQTRMVENLSRIGCYKDFARHDSQYQCDMLHSAKDNLTNLAFFGLTEYQLESQVLFERTFGLKFKSDFYQYNHTQSSEVHPTVIQTLQAQRRNSLDMELYRYAKSLCLSKDARLLRTTIMI